MFSPRQVMHGSSTTTLCSPYQSPDGSTHFGTFEGPNSQHLYSQLLPLIAWGYEFWDCQGPTLPKCVITPSCFPRQSPDRLGARIVGLSRGQNAFSCHMLPALLPTSCIDSNTCSKLLGITPNPSHCKKQPVVVRNNMSSHSGLRDEFLA